MSTLYCAVAQKSVCNFFIIVFKNVCIYFCETDYDLIEELTKLSSNTVITSLSVFLS